MQIEEDLQKEVRQVRYALEGDLKSFGKGFTVIEQVLPLLPSHTHIVAPSRSLALGCMDCFSEPQPLISSLICLTHNLVACPHVCEIAKTMLMLENPPCKYT